MSTKEARGTKRTCQNEECGSRFYDLNRDPIFCPICNMEYRLAPVIAGDEVEEESESADAGAAVNATLPISNDLAGDGDEVSDDDALVSLEDADAEIEGDAGNTDDDTFLEEEDDEGGDVTGIIGSPVSDDEEEN
ncbi:MAG: TIGR02300 family protein [Pseudomonadota bacterium]